MKIFIVEDSKKLADSLKKGLENEGYNVDCYYDGESGEKQLKLNYQDYDLAIFDIMLPKKNGIEVCHDIRNYGINIPVLMLTARNSMNDKVTGLDSGADDYLAKPFEFEELLARIRALLRRPRTALPPELKLKDLVLNPATTKVYRSEKEIPLTLKEFRLLEYFMRNAGITLTREDILNSLWDYDFASFSNVVDVHVKNLRKKVDGGHKEKLFQTVWGVGYKLKEQ
jgi:DNA-binding response OmpR family regulator